MARSRALVEGQPVFGATSFDRTRGRSAPRGSSRRNRRVVRVGETKPPVAFMTSSQESAEWDRNAVVSGQLPGVEAFNVRIRGQQLWR
jgi:hypothetical protein